MVAALISIGFFVVGAVLSWIAWTGSQRRLAPNGLLGLPVPAARSSAPNWYAAHEAAAGPLGLGAGVALTCGVGVVTVGFDVVGKVITGVGVSLCVICVAVALVSAQRATTPEPGT